MTTARNSGGAASDTMVPGVLPFDPAQLTGMRVRPTDFANLCGVSRQAVSKWIKKGIVTLGIDGRIDPALASREVFEKCDPAKLRARIFRDALAPVATLRERIRTLEAQVIALRARNQEIEAKRIGRLELLDKLIALSDAIGIDFAARPPAMNSAALSARAWSVIYSLFFAGDDDDEDEDESDAPDAAQFALSAPVDDAMPIDTPNPTED